MSRKLDNVIYTLTLTEKWNVINKTLKITAFPQMI